MKRCKLLGIKAGRKLCLFGIARYASGEPLAELNAHLVGGSVPPNPFNK